MIDPSIKERFNPCIYLAEFLMRNNPKHGTKSEYTKTFDKWSRIEKIRRFFSSKRPKLYKHFCIQPYQNNFCKSNFGEYLDGLDSFLQMEGKLASNFNWKKYFVDYKDDDAVQWDDFFEILSMWAVSQD